MSSPDTTFDLNPGSAVALEERLDTRQQLDDGDHDRFAHYVPKAKLTEALVMGTPVVALCGKVWVPCRNPEKYPVCPDCKAIWDGLRPGDGDRGGNGGDGERGERGDGGRGE